MNVDAKIGKAVRVNKDVLLYSLVGGQVNHKQTSYNDVLMLTSENGVLLNLDDISRLNIEANVEVSPVDGNPSYLFKGTAIRDLTSQSDLRLVIENDGKDSAAMLRLGLYLN
ncbi:MAG: hypothetical protein EOP52_13665 [Sphingobacteriales bacterium]|nr:MAG: hypothetical protein EOP52_13665 [Sphingobacteriales bacterium]